LSEFDAPGRFSLALAGEEPRSDLQAKTQTELIRQNALRTKNLFDLSRLSSGERRLSGVSELMDSAPIQSNARKIEPGSFLSPLLLVSAQ
jgi:hypothetical protein